MNAVEAEMVQKILQRLSQRRAELYAQSNDVLTAIVAHRSQVSSY